MFETVRNVQVSQASLMARKRPTSVASAAPTTFSDEQVKTAARALASAIPRVNSLKYGERGRASKVQQAMWVRHFGARNY